MLSSQTMQLVFAIPGSRQLVLHLPRGGYLHSLNNFKSQLSLSRPGNKGSNQVQQFMRLYMWCLLYMPREPNLWEPQPKMRVSDRCCGLMALAAT